MYIEEARTPIWLVGQLFISLSHYLHIGTQSLTWEALHEFYSESLFSHGASIWSQII